MRLHPWNYSSFLLLNYHPWNVGRRWSFVSRITWVAILEDVIRFKQVFLDMVPSGGRMLFFTDD